MSISILWLTSVLIQWIFIDAGRTSEAKKLMQGKGVKLWQRLAVLVYNDTRASVIEAAHSRVIDNIGDRLS
jgi:hypothetical protein